MRFQLIVLVLFLLIPVPEGASLGSDRFHHGGGSSRIVDLDSLFAAATPMVESPEACALVEACMARYGGRQRLQDLRGLRLHYRTQSLRNPDSLDVVKSFLRGRRYRIDRIGRDRHEARILNRNRSWYQNPDTVISLANGSRHRAELFSYLTLVMPLGIETERFAEIRYGVRENQPLGYLYMDKPGSLMVCLGIDPEDHTIRSVDGLIRHTDGAFVFENRFSDHRMRDGYLVPHRVTNVSMGLEVGRSTLKRVEVNPELDEELFLPDSRFVRRSPDRKLGTKR